MSRGGPDYLFSRRCYISHFTDMSESFVTNQIYQFTFIIEDQYMEKTLQHIFRENDHEPVPEYLSDTARHLREALFHIEYSFVVV